MGAGRPCEHVRLFASIATVHKESLWLPIAVVGDFEVSRSVEAMLARDELPAPRLPLLETSFSYKIVAAKTA